MARTAAVKDAASANTSKKRKTTSDIAEDLPAKRARRTTTPAVNGTETKPAAATKAKPKATTTTTKKAAATKAATATKAKTTAKAKTTTTKAAPKSKTPEPKANGVKATKRKTAAKPEDEDEVEAEEPAPKKSTKATAAKKAKVEKVAEPPKPKERKKGPVINERSTKQLNVFVFGENSSGELGLGNQGSVIDVKRPRLNPLLKGEKIVDIAAGGMHQAFLTADGRILTCGVNDQGALGRDTAGAEVLRDMDADDSDDEGNGLNPLESTPKEVDLKDVPEGTVFTSLAAGDSVTFAVTDDGEVFGCGTFRSNEGILGFTADVHVQRTLTRLAGVKLIKKIVCGANHALALDKNGGVWAWGSGQQNQLGRRVVERTRMAGLTPREFGLPKKKILDVGSGAYHSFAIDKNGKVWTWGLNSYGECGIEESAGEDDAIIEKATAVEQLSGRGIVQIDGGAHHSMAITDKGEALVWGRTDGYQVGIKVSEIDQDDLIRDEHDKPRILKKAAVVKDVPNAAFAACNSDQSFIINKDGRAFASGFSVNYQTGLGTTDDVEIFTLIDNTATREEKLVFAGAGGQYGVLASVQKAN